MTVRTPVAVHAKVVRVVAPTPTDAGRGSGRKREFLIRMLVFLAVLSGYLLSLGVDQPAYNGDWYLRYQVTCSIVETSTFTPFPFQSDTRTGPGVDGATYSQYTLGQTTALIPFYLLGRTLSAPGTHRCGPSLSPLEVLSGKLLGPLLGALLCTLFFATARLLGYGRRTALALTTILAFGDSLWPDVMSNLEHTLESLFVLTAAYAALRYARRFEREPLWICVMGLAAGLGVVTRVAGLVIPIIFALYIVSLHRRRRPGRWRPYAFDDLITYALCLIPSAAITLTFNALRFGHPLQSGPSPDDSFLYPIWLGVPNLLFSPGKGLIWYSPVLLLLVLAARPFRRSQPEASRLFLIVGVVYVLFYASINYWHGDPSWGPRYLYALLPYLILPLGEVWRRWRGYGVLVKGAVILVLGASFLVQFCAVSVSYWRYSHTLFGQHIDQLEHHDWGWNFNNTWTIAQSPIVAAVAGVVEIERDYISHAPLVLHADAATRYASGKEQCSFTVLNNATLCLTDTDDARLQENWNTFTEWWMQRFPWLTEGQIVLLVALLSGTLVVSGFMSRKMVGGGALTPLGGAIVLGGAGFGSLLAVGAATAPSPAPPLIHITAMGQTIDDIGMRYSVVAADRIVDLPAYGRYGFNSSGRYIVVVAMMENKLTRPVAVKPAFFVLTDVHGHTRSIDVDIKATASAARLYHANPIGSDIPAHGSLRIVLAYPARHLGSDAALLGPGVAMVPLQVRKVTLFPKTSPAHH